MDRMTLDSVFKVIDLIQWRFNSPDSMHLYGAVALVRDEIKNMANEAGLNDTSSLPSLNLKERLLCSQGKRVLAIKEVRSRLRVSLREAVDIVNYWYPKPDELEYKRL